VCGQQFKITPRQLIIAFIAAASLAAGKTSLSVDLNLDEYHRLLNGRYSLYSPPLTGYAPSLLSVSENPAASSSPAAGDPVPGSDAEEEQLVELNLEGEIYLNLQYGGDFSLKKNAVVGAGSEGIEGGLQYDLIERILLEGRVGDRLFVEFDYDSERSEEGLAEETNTYSIMYKGKNDEFLKEVTLGNKYLSIEGSRYVPIDEGNADSFALRALASWRDLYIEGLLRYDVATEGKKQFKGYRKNVDMSVLDVDYVKARYFFLPDSGIDEPTLELYRSTESTGDLTIDGKQFRLLTRGVDYDFDNTLGRIYLEDDLDLDEELLVYYEKGGNAVGSPPLGTGAIIDDTGARVDFNEASFPDYFDTGLTYLYLRKESFNSYWELKNVYYLEDLEGENVYDVEIELLYTLNNGINDNYEGMLDQYQIDASRALITFDFSDGTAFYPRPFPGEEPYDPLSAPYPAGDPRNPFDPSNPVYGGVNYPTADNSETTIHLQYSFSSESFFLDFNLVPGSVKVRVNGAVLDPSNYEVDNEFGIITFNKNVITPASDIVITYKYNLFGEGDKSLFAALGLSYEGPFYRLRNLTSFRGGIRGQEAPEVGSEPSRRVVNSTEFSASTSEAAPEEGGVIASIKGGVAFAVTRKNSYGSALIADMEKDDYLFELDLDDDEWMIATTSVPSILSFTYGSRGDLLYKNYYKSTTFSGDVLQTLSWSIPSGQLFDYAEKAGPYNTADMPSGGNDSSLVLDYEFPAGGTDPPYVSVVTPLNRENLERYQRFNLLLKGYAVSDDVQLYVELIKSYDEDLNHNGLLDGEGSINDLGFTIKPPDGNQTVIGTNREGKSNGRIDSEDLNDNGRLDSPSPEAGAVIQGDGGTEYITQIAAGDQAWKYVSVDILDLIASNPDVFQYANAVRITVRRVGTGTSSGKIVINKIWFSGSAIVNNSENYLSISDVSVYEDSTVRANAFSKEYPGLYEELHGSANYRDRNDYVEKLLRVTLKADMTAPANASISRRFGNPQDLSPYRRFRMFFFLPASQPLPTGESFFLTFRSSQNETMEGSFAGATIQHGWNEFDVELSHPYEIRVNGTAAGNLTRSGTLSVLKRVSEIEFMLQVDSGILASGYEFWLDEWFVSECESYLDKAAYTEGTIEYSGRLLGVGSFPLVEDTALTAGYERLEGSFYDEPDFKSDRYYTDVGMRLLRYADTAFSASREVYSPFRNEEDLPSGLSEGGHLDAVSNRIEVNLEKDYLPVLEHTYDRVVSEDRVIELTKTDFRYKSVKSYDESLGFSEYIDFPFGLYQSYSFLRNWVYENTLTGSPTTSFVLGSTPSASLGQSKNLLLSYTWDINTTSLNIGREKTYGGSAVPDMEQWPESYGCRLGSIFSRPEDTIEDAVLSTRTDLFSYNLSIPLQERVGTFLTFESSFNDSGFVAGSGTRNTLVRHALSLSVPFYFLGNDRIEMVPSLQREISGDYRSVDASLSEWDILLDTARYLFMPPFYYINPLKGLGRAKDYDAVDLYYGSNEITGNSTNTLKNDYVLDTYLQYDPWYVPSSVGIGFSGETTREGGSYVQKRGFFASVDRSLILNAGGEYFDRSLIVSLDYTNERNFTTKLLAQSYGIDTDLNLLKEEWRGWQFQHVFTYIRERQKIGEESFYLFPGDPSGETAVTEKPPKDRIDSKLVVEYLWEYIFRRDPFFAGIDAELLPKIGIRNTERLTLENIYTFTDRERAETFSNIPIRLTLEHESSYRMTENIEFGGHLKTVVGVEEKIIPPSVSGNVLISMGLEIGMYARIIF
jgi:hypothetical protein